MGPFLLRSFGLCLLPILLAHAEITVYHVNNQAAFATATSVGGTYTGVAAYNPSTLVAPAAPTGVMTTIPVALQNSGTVGLGIKQKGSFLGFSIEMSVTNQVLGKNSSLIQVPFLNLMANIAQRAGSVMIRVGGNTQESATLVPVLDNGRVLEKNLTGVTGTTQTPPLDYTTDLLYMMRNVSSMVNVHWFLGVPWFVTQPFDTAIVSASQAILGDYLLGLQAGNEPDMYALHQHRNDTYSPFDYGGEVSDFLAQIASDGADPEGRAKNLLVAPNIANFNWKNEQVWDTGFVDTYHDNLAYLAVEKYPADNCGAMFNNGEPIVDPQTVLTDYLTHDAHVTLLAPYLNSTAYAQSKGKPFLMFETNTASCGGFLGISDSFTAALWGLDYALQMAHSNFSGAMYHLGGQNVFYNATPPTNESTFHQWTVGPLYYSALVMAEALGPSNNSQVYNLPIANLSPQTPVYGIYEDGVPKRVAVVNYIDDASGANDVKVVISIAGGTLPASVKVKYLAAETVVQKGNFTWAGQTFGTNFASDGRPMGEEDIQDVACDTTAQTCTVTVPAPGFALVFLSDDAQTEGAAGGQASVTFATTARTQTRNTATVEPSVLATSNGNRMSMHELAGTSKPPRSGALRGIQISLILGTVLVGVVAGLAVVL